MRRGPSRPKSAQVGATASQLACPHYGKNYRLALLQRREQTRVGVTWALQAVPPLRLVCRTWRGLVDEVVPGAGRQLSAGSFGAAHQNYRWRTLAVLADTFDPDAFLASAPTALSGLRALYITFTGYDVGS